jgi:hypothetical protein
VSILEWLGNFLREFFPPWELVDATHTGVRQRNIPVPAGFRRWADSQRAHGRKFLWLIHYAPPGCVIKRDCGPGFVFKVPFIDQVWELPTEYESEDLDNVQFETLDGTVYNVSPVLTWKSSNPMKSAFSASNYERSNKNAALAKIVAWGNKQSGTIDVDEMSRETTKLVKEVGSEWGCRNKEVTFNYCAPTWSEQVIRHTVEGPLTIQTGGVDE